jgi:hypothetical protein
VREGRAVLSAVGQQRDPPSRLRFSGIRFGANDGARAFAAIDHAAAAAPALAASYGVIARMNPAPPDEVTGRVPPLYPLTRAHEVDSATRWGRHLAAVGRFHFRSIRFGAAVAIGATMELGRSWRTLLMMLLLRPRGAGEPRGHRQQAALKDQRFRRRVPPLYPLTRAHEGRAEPATVRGLPVYCVYN